MRPIWIVNTCDGMPIYSNEKSKLGIGQQLRQNPAMSEKPAKFKPALLQATAVIIIWELSREWTKFGGKAVFCRWTITCNSKRTAKFEILDPEGTTFFPYVIVFWSQSRLNTEKKQGNLTWQKAKAPHWSLPEIMLSQKLVQKIGKQPTECTDFRFSYPWTTFQQ